MKNGWTAQTLIEACQIKPPKSEARERLAADDMVSFLPMEDMAIDEKVVRATQARTLSAVQGSYTYFADGDVLLAKITPCFENGKLGIAGPGGRKELESIALAPWATRRRQDLLDLLDQLTPKIQELTRALEQEVEKRPVARRLTTHPGVGPLTALAFELVIGTPERFHCGKQIASYVGLVPTEESSGDRRRLGHISKQGNVLLRFLLVEAAQVTVRSQPEWRSKFFHLAMRRGRKIAKVAMARKLAVHLLQQSARR
jgi:Transposase IS116/IS110/IS902 family